MRSTPASSPSLARRDSASIDNKSNQPSDFKERKVSGDVPDGAVADEALHSPHKLGTKKTIHDHSVAVSSSDALSVGADNRDDTGSFYSAVSYLDDHFLDANDFFIDESTEPKAPSDTADANHPPSTAADPDIVKLLETADNKRINEYIDDFTEVNKDTGGSSGIAVELEERLKTLVAYNQRLDTDLKSLNELGEKLQKQGLSDAEKIRMKTIINCNQYNLSLAQDWLSAAQKLGIEKGTMNEPTATLLAALSNRLAARQLSLEDSVALHEDKLPDAEPLSRADRAAYNLLTARASLRAFETVMHSQKDTDANAYTKMQEIHTSLAQHCEELEHAVKLVKGEIKLDVASPQLKIELPHAWTENFDLSAKDTEKNMPREEMDKLKSRWDQDTPTLPLGHRWLSQPNMARIFIEHRLKKAGIDTTKLPDYRAAYKQSIITAINQEEWPIIDKPMRYTVGEQAHTCNSQITPGAYLAKQFEKQYKDNGVGCMDRRQIAHVPNLARTQLVGEKGKVLFSGIRHGIIDAYDYNEKSVRKFSDAELTKMAETIYDDKHSTRRADATQRRDPLKAKIAEREQQLRRQKYVQKMVAEIKSDPAARARHIEEIRTIASRNMARELLSAAIVSDPTKLNAALQGKTVDVTMNSVSLVSPDWFHSRSKKGESSDERLMLKHQVQALQSLQNPKSPDEPIKLMIADENGELKEVKVNVKMRTFNFGVNKYALAKTVLPAGFPIWRNIVGWGFSADVNNPQLRELLGPAKKKELGGAVAEKLKTLEQSSKAEDREQAKLLRDAATQAKQIWRKRSFWSGNNEPYKMVSRLTLISHLMDETALFNCKSGKDRTGQLDAEVKYLAAVGHATGHIPEPDAAHTDESRKMRTTFTLDSGNLELQRLNTGLPGYKLRSVPGLKAMMEKGTQAVYEGGSDYVSA